MTKTVLTVSHPKLAKLVQKAAKKAGLQYVVIGGSLVVTNPKLAKVVSETAKEAGLEAGLEAALEYVEIEKEQE